MTYFYHCLVFLVDLVFICDIEFLIFVMLMYVIDVNFVCLVLLIWQSKHLCINL